MTSLKDSRPAASPGRPCDHCGLPVPAFRVAGKTRDEAVFCCEGCRTVYQIITGNNLQEYYAIRRRSEAFSDPKPAATVISRYAYLDDSEVKKKLAYGQELRCMDFYIEGVHCVACLWLIERIGKLVPGVSRCEMNLGSRVAKVSLEEEGSFSAIAEGFERIGYKPHPVSEGAEAADLSRAENRREMIRIGVTGFCMMNIMILFVSIYAGADESVLTLFRWLSGILFLPVATLGAAPFYRGAISAFKARQINVDLPVAGAIMIGSAASLWNLAAGSNHIYFDSLTAFVFLLLSARYALKTLYQKTTSQMGAGEFLIPRSVLRYNGETQKEEVVALDRIRIGECFWVPQGEVAAADGEVVQGEGFADFHMISGESAPVKLYPGSQVYAGTVNVGPDLLVRVSAVGQQTRIERLLQSVANLEKPKTVQLADAAAKKYLAAIFAGSLGVLFACRWLGFSEAFDRALSMIIIACPCALALATPLAYRMATREASRLGVLLKGASVLDKLAEARTLYLDKTGTLTKGSFRVLDWNVISGDDPFFSQAYVLEKKSRHPVALALRDYAQQQGAEKDESTQVTEYNETPGVGVSGWVDGRFYEIKGGLGMGQVKSLGPAVSSTVGIYEAGNLKVVIHLGDQVRDDSRQAVQKLRLMFDNVEMLTGDGCETAEAVARYLEIPRVTAAATPERKKEIVAAAARSLMVGDGANDCAAMKAASVSLAVQGSIETSFQSADAYLTVPGIGSLAELIHIARRTQKVVWTALIVSLLYNAAGIVFAVLGYVTPLTAAVVMPLSSFTVLAIAAVGIHWRSRV